MQCLLHHRVCRAVRGREACGGSCGSSSPGQPSHAAEENKRPGRHDSAVHLGLSFRAFASEPYCPVQEGPPFFIPGSLCETVDDLCRVLQRKTLPCKLFFLSENSASISSDG